MPDHPEVKRIEVTPSLEQTREVAPKESVAKAPAKEPVGETPPSPPVMTPPSVTALSAKPALVQDIESVLEEGLSELYVSMPEALQSEFKIKGEETTRKIVQILERGKNIAKKVFETIVEWLKLIPGVNKFFLEQEAKIKTDKILNIKK